MIIFFIIKHVIISYLKYVFHCLQFFSLYIKGRIEQDLDPHTVNILYQDIKENCLRRMRMEMDVDPSWKWLYEQLRPFGILNCTGVFLFVMVTDYYSHYDATNFVLTVCLYVNGREAYASQSRSSPVSETEAHSALWCHAWFTKD